MKTRINIPFIIVFAMAMLLCRLKTGAQSPVASFSSSYVSASSTIGPYNDYPAPLSGSFTSCASTLYTYTYSNGSANQQKLTGFTASSKSFIVAPGANATVKLRRVNNSNVTGNRNIVFMETTSAAASNCPSGTLAFKLPYNDVMESFLDNNIINQGTDNVFTNAGNGDRNYNNIERIDVLFTSGLSASVAADAGFIILDRGGDKAHDPFRIAAITSLDINGDPAAFGTVKTCTGGNGSNNGSWGHPSIANGNKQLSVYVLRKDPSETYMKVSAAINQEMGGVMFTFADLGIAAGQTIYGYALIGPDGTANPSSAQLLNTSSTSVYPQGTTEGDGGGLDLISVNTVFVTGSSVLLPMQIISFSVAAQNDGVLLQWQLGQAESGHTVDLERSEDGIQFYPMYSTKALASPITMSYTDKPAQGVHYYRLKISRSLTGEWQYSHTLALAVNANTGWRVYPTMANRSEKIKLEGLADGYYSAGFCSLSGAMVKMNVYVQNNHALIGQPPGGLAPGVYMLTLNNGKQPSKGSKIYIY